jgi:hypothetical protein
MITSLSALGSHPRQPYSAIFSGLALAKLAPPPQGSRAFPSESPLNKFSGTCARMNRTLGISTPHSVIVDAEVRHVSV